MEPMANEERTTAASTRTSVMRLRGLAVAGLGLMAAAATVAAGSPTPSASASDGTSATSTLAVKVSVTSPTGGEARQGQTISYSVRLTPASGTTYKTVNVTLSASPDWAAKGLKVTCPTGATAATDGCTFTNMSTAQTINATVATTTAKVGDKTTLTAAGKDDTGSFSASSGSTSIIAKPSHSPTPTPTPTQSKTSSSTPKPTGASGGSSSGGGSTGGSSGGGSSGGTSGGGGSSSGSSSGGGSGGAGSGRSTTTSGSHGSSSTTDPVTGGGRPHPTALPTGTLSAAPSLGVGSSLSATSLPGISTSPAPTPLVAIPPTSGTSGSPSLPIRLSGESSGTVRPVTTSVPLAAVGLVLFVVSGWRLLRRRVRKAASKGGD